jgi:uncharacterized protein with HEPN domain
MLDAAEKIIRYTEEVTFDGFIRNEMLVDAVIRQHKYFGIDLKIVWDIVPTKAPTLDAQIGRILSEIN